MAVFGAPVAHEDDPERAVRAALAIRDWSARAGASCRCGSRVNTGEALVTLGARPAEGEGMAAGDVVNTAARLQAAAPVDGVLVGEATYRATARRDRVPRRADPSRRRARPSRSPVWEAVEARSRFGVDVAERARTPLVGRERELELLRRRARARARGALGAARHARRRSRDRQEPAGRRALPGRSTPTRS